MVCKLRSAREVVDPGRIRGGLLRTEERALPTRRRPFLLLVHSNGALNGTTREAT